MLHLYNTRTREKAKFVPLEEGKVGLYVCGITVYDLSHMGHARTYLSFDVLVRYLRHLGYDVNTCVTLLISTTKSLPERMTTASRLKHSLLALLR